MKKIVIVLGVSLLLAGCAQPFGKSVVRAAPVVTRHHASHHRTVAQPVTQTVAPVEQPAPVATPKKKRGFWSRFPFHWHKQTPE